MGLFYLTFVKRKKIHIPRFLQLIFLSVSLYAFLLQLVWFSSYTVFRTFQQLIYFTFSSGMFIFIINARNYIQKRDYYKVLNWYLRIALIMIILGIVQVFWIYYFNKDIFYGWRFLAGLNPSQGLYKSAATHFSDTISRATSFATEPSAYGFFAGIALLYFWKNVGNIKKLILLTGFILCFSASIYFCLFITLLITFLLKIDIKRILLFSLLLFSFLLLFSEENPITNRFVGLFSLYQSAETTEVYTQELGSALSNYTAFVQTIINFKKSFGFGVGMGGYFNQFNTNLLLSEIPAIQSMGDAKVAGFGLFYRGISEFGVMFIFINIFIFIYLIKNIRNNQTKNYAVTLLFIHIANLLRISVYFNISFFIFFAFLYVFNMDIKEKKLDICKRQDTYENA